MNIIIIFSAEFIDYICWETKWVSLVNIELKLQIFLVKNCAKIFPSIYQRLSHISANLFLQIFFYINQKLLNPDSPKFTLISPWQHVRTIFEILAFDRLDCILFHKFKNSGIQNFRTNKPTFAFKFHDDSSVYLTSIKFQQNFIDRLE